MIIFYFKEKKEEIINYIKIFVLDIFYVLFLYFYDEKKEVRLL